MPHDLHYAYPFLIYGLYLIPIYLLLFIWLYRFRERMSRQFPRGEVVIPRSTAVYWFQVIGLCVAWVFGIFALMQPLGNGYYPKERQQRSHQRKLHDVIVLFDASASMTLNDTRTGESRFAYGKEIADIIIGGLRGENIALTAFTSEPTKLVPLTLDYLFARLMLQDMKINEGAISGTNFFEVLSDVKQQYYSGPSIKDKTLIIISDGGDTVIESLSDDERSQQINALSNLTAHTPDNKLRVYSVGIGSKEGKLLPKYRVLSKLDEGVMKALSDSGQGKYYYANEWSTLDLAQDLLRMIEKRGAPLEDFGATTQGKEDLIYHHYFQYPLAAALFILILVFSVPETTRRKREV